MINLPNVNLAVIGPISTGSLTPTSFSAETQMMMVSSKSLSSFRTGGTVNEKETTM
jgi:hypothetical protein